MSEPAREAEGRILVRTGALEAELGLHAGAEISHRDVRVRLSDYLDGQLSEREQRLITAHLDRCADCRAFRNTLRETIRLLKSLDPPATAPSLASRLTNAVRSRAGG